MGKEPRDAAHAGQPSVSSVHTGQGGQGGECPGGEPAGDRDGDLSQGTVQVALRGRGPERLGMWGPGPE